MYNKEIYIREGLNEGYKYFCDKEHPLAKGNSGMVLYHRHVASLSINRWVTTNEVVHHIDEDKLNNTPSNLEVLSRSEHAKIHSGAYLVDILCPICAKIFLPRESNQKYCSNNCRTTSYIKFNITKEELEKDIWSTPYSGLTHKYGLSDVGIKKRAKALGCKIPPPYFHNKSIEDKLRLYKDANID